MLLLERHIGQKVICEYRGERLTLSVSGYNAGLDLMSLDIDHSHHLYLGSVSLKSGMSLQLEIGGRWVLVMNAGRRNDNERLGLDTDARIAIYRAELYPHKSARSPGDVSGDSVSVADGVATTSPDHLAGQGGAL